jgi:PBSX family phage terminase large subunit
MPKMAKSLRSRTSAEPPDGDEMEVRLTPIQAGFVGCAKHFVAYAGGVGAGKSFVGSYSILVQSKPGDLIAVCAPTFRQLADSTQRSFVEMAVKMGLWDEAAYRKTDNQAILTNNVEVLFRSADNPHANRGPNLRRVWLDEAGLMDEEMFNVMIGRLRFGGDLGYLTATFTPQGKAHWTYRLFTDTTNPNVALFRSATRDNPFLAPEFYESLLLQYGKGEGGLLRAQQELEGMFVCVAGAEWGAECFGEEVWFDEWPQDDRAIKVVMLDSSKGIGGKTGDYSCFAKVMYARGLLWVEFDMDNTRNASGMAERAIQIQQKFKADFFGVETEFGGAVLVDDLQNRAEAAKLLMPLVLVPTAGMQKDVRIRRLTPYLTQRMIRFKRTEATRLGVSFMESFPHSPHDDAEDSLEGAIRIINESGMLAA